MGNLIGWFRGQARIVQAVIGCGSLLGVCMLCGLTVAVGSALGNVAGTPAEQATATTAPTATATPSQAALAAAYTSFVAGGLQPLAADTNAIGNDCGAADVQSCHDDALQFQLDIASFQSDLDAHPAPHCLAAADKDLRTGLSYYATAAGDVVDGIDQSDVALLDEGVRYMRAGNKQMAATTTAIHHAVCH